MLIFNRQQYSQLWITLRSDESLSVIDTGYMEDYFGVDGQLTLRSMEDDTRTPFMMNEVTSITPSVPHDAFEGYVDLTGLPNGTYRVEGRVRDVLGHYRILSEVQSPLGTESVSLFEILITPEAIIVYAPKMAVVSMPEQVMAETIAEPLAQQIVADVVLSAPQATITSLPNSIKSSLMLQANPSVSLQSLMNKSASLSLVERPTTVNRIQSMEADVTVAYVQ